jgi:hypothetical protein
MLKIRLLLGIGLAAVSLILPVAQVHAADPGNSDAAKACQQGGYLGLLGSDGTTFSNTGACVSYAARGGTFATGIVIPAGHTATLGNGFLSGCDSLTGGYQLNFGDNVPLASGGGCNFTPFSGGTIGPFSTATLLRIYLTDNSFGDTFYSDGNHAMVWTTNPYLVDILDSGAGSATGSTPRYPQYPGDANLEVTVTIN